MPSPPQTPAPAGTIPAEKFYSEDERRATGRDLSYGSGWKRAGWSDDTHVVQLYWMKDSHELVAFYIAYDWSRVDPSELKVSALEAVGEEAGGGLELGQSLRVQDEAAAEIHVEVLAHLDSKHQRREVMHGWHWLQHHPDGLDEIRARIARITPDEP
jgi:hypothetical protein